MTRAEERAMWSRVTPEQWEAATRIAVRFFTGKDPEPEKNTEPEPEPELQLFKTPQGIRV